jgi:GINS complex protein helical bundle domain
LFEQREREFMLAKVRVKMRTSVENIDAGDYKIESMQAGQSAELPRWVAEELTSLNLAETSDEPFETEIFRALSKEKMMGPLQLSALPEDFYLRMRRRVEYLGNAVRDGRVRKEEHEKLKGVCYDLIGMRLSKLLSLSSSSTKASDMGEKLSPEEKAFFNMAQASSLEWKAALLGDGR